MEIIDEFDDADLFDTPVDRNPEAFVHNEEAAAARQQEHELKKKAFHDFLIPQDQSDETDEEELEEKERKRAQTLEAEEKEREASMIFNSYAIHDLFWCRGAWLHKKTQAKFIFYPCAQVPKFALSLPNVKFDSSISKRKLWRLGIPQPSTDGFKYVEEDEDLIPFDPSAEDFKLYWDQLKGDETLPDKNGKTRKHKLTCKHEKEFQKARDEAMKIYNHALSKEEAQVDEFSREAEGFDFSQSSEATASTVRGTRKKHKQSKIKICDSKFELNVGDILTYSNVTDAIAGSQDAARQSVIVEITAKHQFTLQNAEEHIFNGDDLVHVSRNKKSYNWRKFRYFTFGKPGKLDGVSTVHDFHAAIYKETLEAVHLAAEKANLGKRKRKPRS